MTTIDQWQLLIDFTGWDSKPSLKYKGKVYCNSTHSEIHCGLDSIIHKYKTSWDYLMPACKKFIDLDTSHLTAIEFMSLSRYKTMIRAAILSFDILLTYNQLVEAIQWHNQKGIKSNQ